MISQHFSEAEASVYKRLLEREQLKQPNRAGIDCFKRTWRPQFVRSSSSVSEQMDVIHEKQSWTRIDEADEKKSVRYWTAG